MAKGAEEKEIVKNKILEVFPQAFVYDKEIRIPINDVEIKINFVCAKENIGGGAANSQPVVSSNSSKGVGPVSAPTQEELDNVKTIMSRLNL